jgi:hypothetical protein
MEVDFSTIQIHLLWELWLDLKFSIAFVWGMGLNGKAGLGERKRGNGYGRTEIRIGLFCFSPILF